MMPRSRDILQVLPVKSVLEQWKRLLSYMSVAVDGLQGGDVGLAAKAVATRGSRPNGLSTSLSGDRGPHGLSLMPITLGCDLKPL